jgi:signal-transduction protein with cAMP-binding, CBS, and nucleotidyltransferase domain
MQHFVCKVCGRLQVHNNWYFKEELEEIPSGDLFETYCRYCVMEMSLSRYKELVNKLNLRLIDIALPLYEVGADLSVQMAAINMTKHKTGILGTIRDDQLVGIITERDIIRRLVAKKLDPVKTPISSVMSHPVKTIVAEASLPEATLKMSLERIRHLVIRSKSSPYKVVSVKVLSDTMFQVLSQAYTIGKQEGEKKGRRPKRY